MSAFAAARARRPDLANTFDRLGPVLGDPTHPAAARFQQTSGMVMAKGVEDRAFYRWNRLCSLTEVGGDPDEFAISVATFHQRQRARQADHPASMTTLSTHDTKRGEDVRARLDVLSELPEVWAAFLANVRPNDSIELLVWQAIVGAWPATRERLKNYTIKAAREAGMTTDWNDVDEPAEKRLLGVVDRAFDDPTTRALVEGMVATVRGPGWSNSLTAKLVQLTAPGVPDVYQGSELWEMSLVDPDNRRPVDFAERAARSARSRWPWHGATADRRDRPGQVARDDTRTSRCVANGPNCSSSTPRSTATVRRPITWLRSIAEAR